MKREREKRYNQILSGQTPEGKLSWGEAMLAVRRTLRRRKSSKKKFLDECYSVDQLEAKASELKIRINDALRNNDAFETSEYRKELRDVKAEIKKQKKILGIR